jgi:hypothetical protein
MRWIIPLLLASFLLAPAAFAADGMQVALFLANDVSPRVDGNGFNPGKHIYAAAFSSQAVPGAIQGGAIDVRNEGAGNAGREISAACDDSLRAEVTRQVVTEITGRAVPMDLAALR